MPRSNRPRRHGRPRTREGGGVGQGTGGGRGRRNAAAGGPRREEMPDDAVPGLRALRGVEAQQDFADGTYHVRYIPSYAALKDYRCPGCQQLIRPGVSHVVAWRADGPWADAVAQQERRHWHGRCFEHHAPRAH